MPDLPPVSLSSTSCAGRLEAMSPRKHGARASSFAIHAAALISLGLCSSAIGCGAPASRTVSAAPEASLGRGPAPTEERTGLLGCVRYDQSVALHTPELSGEQSAQCAQCHGARPDLELKVNDVRPTTDKKEASEIMHHGFAEGLRPREGGEMTCATCHVDRTGSPRRSSSENRVTPNTRWSG